MADDNFEDDAARGGRHQAHSGKHPIPTIQGYREHRRGLRDRELANNQDDQGPDDASKPRRALGSVKKVLKDEDDPSPKQDPYPATNHNYSVLPPGSDLPEAERARGAQRGGQAGHDGHDGQDGHDAQDARTAGNAHQGKSATEAAASALDPKAKRKAMKRHKRTGVGRDVTDPVTHLPITIYDQTEKDLKWAPENEPEPGREHVTATGIQGAAKSPDQLDREQRAMQRGHNGVQRLFPPPDYADLKMELNLVYQRAIYAGLGLIGLIAGIPFAVASFNGQLLPQLSTVLGLACVLLAGLAVAVYVSQWMGNKVDEIFDDETWDAARREEFSLLDSDTELPESVQWLNSLLASVWPLVNPDLFSSLADMIEDVMQASLPKVIKMVSIDDLGQGNESIRILGVRWLPTGAASRSVGSDGKLEKPDRKRQSDRTNSENAQESDAGEDDGDQGPGPQSKQDEQEQIAMREGMEAEEGDFVNLELAFAYRSRSSGKSIKEKAKNAHLYLKFYLPGGIAVPVWVELRGIIGTMRLRLQLTPDPPFVSLCTLTFLGQPKASLACVPLSRRSLNLMDVPLISSFVQSAIDAALAEYVAPKSLTLNLQDMLVGEDFKKDTASRGVVWMLIKRAVGFKQGDGGIGPKEGSSDSYVTVSWGKFGKPVATTRIIQEDQEPVWHEYASILVSAEELNAEEKLRLQLWDSDKWTADDDLGRVEVDLKTLINSPDSYNRMQDREDRFTGQDPGEKMAGSLIWSVGYFSKARITQKQLEQQTVDENIRSKGQMKQHVSGSSANKLREAGKAPDDDELHQQKAQDYKSLEDAMVISAPPPKGFPSGILSIQIHNITGLEVQRLQKANKDDEESGEDETEKDDTMPDSYCTIILNHKSIYKTRTKPKNSKPFFNAGTERFVRDWESTEVMISVRDAREREDDPLIGIVYLPLAKAFANRSQLVDNFPLVGGIGYGRARISMVWRSVELKMPPNLRGWDYGTLEIRGAIKANQALPENLRQNRMKLATNTGHVKLYADGGQWKAKSGKADESVFLAVRKRFASCLTVEIRESSWGPDRTPAFAVLWLQELTDEQDEVKTLKVWKGGKDNMKKATSCCSQDGKACEGDVLGEIEVSLKLWRGLSGFHKAYAARAKKGDMRSVMECLDTITDENLAKDEGEFEYAADGGSDSSEGSQKGTDSAAKKKLKVHTNDDSSAESSGGEGHEHRSSSSSLSLGELKKSKKILRNPVSGAIDTATSVLAPGHVGEDDGSRGVRNSLRDYRDHHKELHRKHRGIMQWRIAREADHLGGKLTRLKGDVGDLFRHGDKETSVETEV